MAVHAEKDRGAWPMETLPRSWAWAAFDIAFENVTSSDKKLAQKDYAVAGTIAVIDQGQAEIGGYTSDQSLRHPSALPVIIFGDHTKCVKFISTPFVQGADGVKVLRPRGVIDPQFAFHSLRTVALPDRGYARHYKFLTATSIPLPPLNEQRRIVAKLDALQERSRRARASLDAVPALLDKLRQSILAAAFRGDLTRDFREQHKDLEPASKLLQRIRTERRKKWEEAELAKLKAKGKAPTDDKWKAKYKEPDPVDPTGLPTLPDGWCWASVEELTTHIVDCLHRTPDYVSAGFPAIRTADVVPGRLLLEQARRVSRIQYAEQVSRLVPEEGDVLYTREGERFGLAALVPPNVQLCMSQRMMQFRVVPLMEPAYFMWSLNSPVCYAQAVADVGGSTSPHVNISAIRCFAIPLAPQCEQQVLAKCIETIWSNTEQVALEHLSLSNGITTLDRAILAKAFRGELVPQDPRDEPADELLARVRADQAAPSTPRGRKRAAETALHD